MDTKIFAHPIFGLLNRVVCSTDNNCVSVVLDFGQNEAIAVDAANSFIMLDRARLIRSERETSQKQFTALKCRDSFFSFLVFSSGALIVVGLQDSRLTRLCVTKSISSIVDTLEYPVWLKRVSIVNTVSTFNRFGLNFISLRDFFVRHCISFNYVPETFPGMFFKIRVPSRPLENTETLGGYYTQAALRSVKGWKRPPKGLFRVKTILVFKMGKCTVLGECGGDDMDVISKLLFGFFFYFIDHRIKLSEPEVHYIKHTYGIPPLEWYIYTHFFFYTHSYSQPSYESVHRAAVGVDNASEIDPAYYGTGSIQYVLSPNLLTSSSNIISHLKKMKKCHLLSASSDGVYVNEAQTMLKSINPRADLPTNANATKKRSCDSAWMNINKSVIDIGYDPLNCMGSVGLHEVTVGRKVYSVAAVNSAVMEMVREATSVGCFSGIRIYDSNLVAALYGKAGEERVIGGCRRLIRRNVSKEIEEWNLEEIVSHRYAAGSRVCNEYRLRKDHSKERKRLETLLLVHNSVSDLMNGKAIAVADAIGSDIYSVLHDAKNVPPSRGLNIALRKALGFHPTIPKSVYLTGANMSPGSKFFDSVFSSLPQSRKRLCTMPPIKHKTAVNASTAPSQYSTKCRKKVCNRQPDKELAATLLKMQLEDAHTRRVVDEEEMGCLTKGNKLTPMDFIESVKVVRDEEGKPSAAGVEVDLGGILEQLERGDFYSPEETPMANYRTSLQRSAQARITLQRIITCAISSTYEEEEEGQDEEYDDCFPDTVVVNRFLKGGGVAKLNEYANVSEKYCCRCTNH